MAKLNMTKKIKQICIEKDIPLRELGTKVGLEPSSFYVKLARKGGIVKIEDAEKILDVLGCDLIVVDRETKKVY